MGLDRQENGRKNRRGRSGALLLIALAHCVLRVVSPAVAADSLGVGWRGSIERLNQGASESRFLAIRADSIWTWDVQPNSNLAPATV